MKKSLLAVVAALAIAGCSQTEIDNEGKQDGRNAISFNTLVGKNPRAVINNSNFESFKLSSFIVEAADIATTGLGTPYMNNITYSGGQNNWTTTDGTFYWPSEKMQFFGYHPSATFEKPATGYPNLGYTLTASADQDIVVAYAKDAEKPSLNANLALTFKHIMTRINFSAEVVDGFTYTITAIKITGTSGNTGKFTFDKASDDTTEGAKVGTWVVSGNEPAEGYTYVHNSSATADVNHIIDLTNSENDNSLMLFPQTDLSGVKISITYSTMLNSKSFYTGTKEFEFTAGEWKMGQSIRYKLALPAGADKINVTPSVDDNNWNIPSSGTEIN